MGGVGGVTSGGVSVIVGVTSLVADVVLFGCVVVSSNVVDLFNPASRQSVS